MINCLISYLILIILVLILSKICFSHQDQVEVQVEVKVQVEDQLEVTLKELMRICPLPINPYKNVQTCRKGSKPLLGYNIYCMVFYLNLEYLNIPNLKDPKLKHLASKLYGDESQVTKAYYKSMCKYFVESNKNYSSICNSNSIKSKENHSPICNYNSIKSKENNKSTSDYIIIEMEPKENNELIRDYTIKSKENTIFTIYSKKWIKEIRMVFYIIFCIFVFIF